MTRTDDERLLLMLILHKQGLHSRDIAPRVGLTQRQTASTIARLKNDDIAYDPEAAHYWAAPTPTSASTPRRKR
jgi:hypothetical protein